MRQYSDIPAIKENLSDFETQTEKANAEANKKTDTAAAFENQKTLKQMDINATAALQKDKDLNLNHGDSMNKRFENFGKTLDPSQASSRSPVGVAAVKFNTAERLETLGKAFADGNQIRDAEMEELAMGVANLLSGTSASARSQVEALVPKTAMGNAMKLKQWLMNEPTGLNQKEFVNRIMGTISREKATAADQIKRAQYTRIAPFKNLQDADPERFNDVLLSSGVDPKEYSDWELNGHKSISAVQQPEGSSAFPGAPEVGTVKGGYTYKGGNPNDKNNWTK
jgi:flagellar biosynthesis/type III secretory pathway chaperone